MAAAVNHSVVRKFQSTLPWWERQTPFTTIGFGLGFNPRSRGGSDPGDLDNNPHTLVSIHAPVVGATSDDLTVQDIRQVSIHAPVVGATHLQ